MKNLFKAAHKMTKEITKKYKNVDYRAQFGLCLVYLQEKGEKNMNMKSILLRESVQKKIQELSLEDLNKIKATINKEIERRQDKKVIYTHECKESAKHHKNKYKHWTKKIESIDTTKTNGYAFVGEFLNINQEHKIAVGSIVVECCGDDLTAYRILENEKEEICSAQRNSLSGMIEELSKLV